MRDQAAALRDIAAARAVGAPSGAGHALVIGSGKGGVGKSVLAVLLAAELARRGQRVLLLDGAQNQGNLHILLGVRPRWRLEALLRGEAEPEDLLLPVEERLWLLPGDSGAEAVYALAPVDRARLHHRLCALYDRFDAVLIDAGPGIESVVRVATMRAGRLVVVAVPEPAALSDAYALMKIMHLQVPSLPVEVLINRAASEAEGRAAFDRLSLAAERFLRREVGFLGAIAEDDGLRRAARQPGELLGARHPGIAAVAERLPARSAHAR